MRDVPYSSRWRPISLAKPLFEHVVVKFADGNRYGLIGANGIGKTIQEYLESQRIEF
jgi:ABC-type multidrug transport system ATPase subunit